MSTTHEFYRVRAAEARLAAEAASLDNVRERHLTAAAAWDTMAERGERTVRKRAETEAFKAAALAADPLAIPLAEPPAEAIPPAEEKIPE